MLDWIATLDANVVTVVSSMATAAATVVLAALTFVLVLENRALRKAGNEPDIVAYLRPDSNHLNLINITFSNVGRGPAYDIYVELQAEKETIKDRSISEYFIGKKRMLSALSQGDSVTYLFCHYLEFFANDGADRKFDIEINYRTNDYRFKKESFELAVGDFHAASRSGVPPIYEISSALQKISKVIDGWTRGNSRLKIESATSKELRKDFTDQVAAAKKANEKLEEKP